MDSARNVVVNVGMGRLFHELLQAALSNHGWRVLDSDLGPPQCNDLAELILVAGSDATDAVIDRLRRARAQFPSGKIVLLVAEASEGDIVRFIEEGASAYISASDSLTEFISILKMVRDNRTSCSGRITQNVLASIRRRSMNRGPTRETSLTTREEDILGLIREGLSNKEIASRLSITPNTVKNHVHHLLEKLKVRSRHEAVWRCGLRPQPSLRWTFQTGTDL